VLFTNNTCLSNSGVRGRKKDVVVDGNKGEERVNKFD